MNKLGLIVTLLTISAITGHSQPYRNLIFEGAGIRGVAFAGAIKELENTALLTKIQKVGGTSAGAIAALTVALGYTADEIETIIYNTRLQRFNDGKYFFIGGLSRLNRNYGWYQGEAFTNWLEKIIAAKTGHPDITFKELHNMKFRDLYVTGTSLNNQKLIVFSHETYPDMKIKDAVRISMSIPLYFEAVCIDSSGHVVNKRRTKLSYDIMVDGGFTGNFPIFIFDSLQNQVQYSRIANCETLGLRIDSPQQIEYAKCNNGLAPVPIKQMSNYVNAFYTYVIENLNSNTLTPEDQQRSISISSGTIGAKIRKLSVDEKNLLIRNGQSAVREYLLKTGYVN